MKTRVTRGFLHHTENIGWRLTDCPRGKQAALLYSTPCSQQQELDFMQKNKITCDIIRDWLI